jgi:hypothetical protein
MVEMEKSKSLKIIEYQFDSEYLQGYFKLIFNLYKDCDGIRLYVESMRKLLSDSNPFFKNNKIWNYIIFDNNEAVGHISAIIDMRLFEDKKIGLIGFFESIDNKEVSDLLIKKAEEKLKSEKCEIIRAPINLSIWHSYRFTINPTKNSLFYFEPITKDYYPGLFLANGFYENENYYSAERTDFNTILDYTKADYKNLINNGYKFRTISKENFQNDLNSIYLLSKEIFKGSKNYVDITFDEFKYLYSDIEKISDSKFIEIVSNPEGKDIGFCFSIKDPLNPNIIILKTIGVLNEFQGKKIGAGLLYSQHKKASEEGCNKFIYVLISDDTKIKKLPYPGARVIRNYKTYEKKV